MATANPTVPYKTRGRRMGVELQRAHAQLDHYGVPRVNLEGQKASLAWRISFLAGQLESARMASAHVETVRRATRRASSL